MSGSPRWALACSVAAMTACLAACSSGSSATSGSSSSSPSATSSTSASSSAAAGGGATPSAAGQQYLSLTAAADAALTGFLAQPNTAPVAQVQAAATKAAAAETTLLAGLKNASWPASAQAPITALEAAIPAEQAAYQACAAAPTIAAIKALLTQHQADIATRVTAAHHVRQVLGLPEPTPTGSTPAGAPASPSTSATD